MNLYAEIMRWLDEQEKEMVGEVLKLTHDGAKLTKYAIVTGKLAFHEAVKMKLEQLNLEDSNRTNP